MLKQIDKADDNGIEKEIAKDIALVEYYFKVHITGDYLIMKRFNQQEHLKDAFELDARRFGLSKK